MFLAGALSHQILLPRWQALTRRWPRLPELGVAILAAYCCAHFFIGLNHNLRDALAVLLFAARCRWPSCFRRDTGWTRRLAN